MIKKLTWQGFERYIASSFNFISSSCKQQISLVIVTFLLFSFFELQDGIFEIITERASFCVCIFTCMYQQRYTKRLFLSRNCETLQSSTTVCLLFHYFYIFINFFFQADQATVMINRGGNIREGGFAYFIEEKFYHLNIAPAVKRVAENSLSCAFSCLSNLACFSFNFAAFPDQAGKFTCEFLSSDKYNNSEKFLPSKTFHHFSVVVRNLTLNCALTFGKPEC